MRGGIGTVAGADDAHFFGPEANHMVVGPTVGDSYVDVPLDEFFTGDAEDGYIGDGIFGTHHVADLVSETDMSDFDGESLPGRTTRTVAGFMSGMAEPSVEGSDNPYLLTDSRFGDQPRSTNFTMTLDATENSVIADGEVWDARDQNDVVDGFVLGFGGAVSDGEFLNAFADDDRFAAYVAEDHERTRTRTDGFGEVSNQEEFNAGSYIVSGKANPVSGFAHCTDCDFIDWGWWGTRVVTEENAEQGVPEYREDYVHMGTWVAGAVSTPEQIHDAGNLPFGGEASYSGTVLGSVARQTADGVAKYIASGDLDMQYSFSNREGFVQIDNFDGSDGFDPVSVSGSVQDNSSLDAGSVLR